ncbi:MAG: helix-turn-helix domain-containing protein, partial [Candidatus Methanospirareceae archaeon]
MDMLLRKFMQMDFHIALRDELWKRGMSLKDLSKKAGIPMATLYKISTGRRDPRLSTVKKILNALEPEEKFVAVIAAKFLLDELDTKEVEIKGKKYKVKEYPSNSVDECVIAAVKAEKEGASAIICAPVLSS